MSLISFQRLLTQVISISKSTNVTVRTNSLNLFKALLVVTDPHDALEYHKMAVSELLSLPKSGKTASSEHRTALYSMLSFLPPSEGVSVTLVQATTPLLSKEPSEAAIAVLASALPSHIVFLFRQSSLPPETVRVIAKEMGNTKPAIRKAFVGLAASVFMGERPVLDTESGVVFAKTLLPSFESSLKNVSANPLNNGAFEGYVAIAVLLGPFVKSKEFGLFCERVRLDLLLIAPFQILPFGRTLWYQISGLSG